MNINKVKLPLREPIADKDGKISPQWLNALTLMQQSLNQIIEKLNTL